MPDRRCVFGVLCWSVFFLMIRRPPRSTQSRSSAASDVYKRQDGGVELDSGQEKCVFVVVVDALDDFALTRPDKNLSLIHISEPTRPY